MPSRYWHWTCSEERHVFLGRRRWGLALLPALLAWPLLHALVGGAGGGRTNWIVSQPFIGVIMTAMNGVFPAFSVALALIVLALLIGVIGGRQRSSGEGLHPLDVVRSSREAWLLLSGAAAFLMLICLIDLIKPLAVERYFIVLLPCLALALGDVGQGLIGSGSPKIRRATIFVLTVILSMHLWHSQEVISAKAYPLQNYKALSRFIGDSGICSQGCASVSAKKSRLKPYFNAIHLVRVDPDKAENLSAIMLPFVGLHGEQKFIQPLLEAHPGASCWEPRQFTSSSTFVVIGADAQVRPKSYGLRECARHHRHNR
ncbi:hypothetical protein KBY97_11275 [Synechococcus sp. ATX 2A4]|nr:hypothetical protein [Synechococcus sp. ATX 2A4]